MTDKSDAILVFSGLDAADQSGDVRRGLADALERASVRASEVVVGTLQENIRRFLSALDAVIGASPKDVGGLTLDEVEVHAQVDGKGNVGLSGVAGAEFAAQGGIKFVLRKKT